jgi:hypothetical protein
MIPVGNPDGTFDSDLSDPAVYLCGLPSLCLSDGVVRFESLEGLSFGGRRFCEEGTPFALVLLSPSCAFSPGVFIVTN